MHSPFSHKIEPQGPAKHLDRCFHCMLRVNYSNLWWLANALSRCRPRQKKRLPSLAYSQTERPKMFWLLLPTEQSKRRVLSRTAPHQVDRGACRQSRSPFTKAHGRAVYTRPGNDGNESEKWGGFCPKLPTEYSHGRTSVGASAAWSETLLPPPAMYGIHENEDLQMNSLNNNDRLFVTLS